MSYQQETPPATTSQNALLSESSKVSYLQPYAGGIERIALTSFKGDLLMQCREADRT